MIELTSETLSYASSVDGTQPLLADVVFAANGRLKPLLLVMHGYRSGNPDLSAADELLLADVLAPKPHSPRLPPVGRLVVPGYLVTRRFQVWLGDGQRGRAVVEYDCRGPAIKVAVVENPGGFPVRVEPFSPLPSLQGSHDTKAVKLDANYKEEFQS